MVRTFGYVGCIASSAITGIVFRSRGTDHGVHTIAWIMVGIRIALVLITLSDHYPGFLPSIHGVALNSSPPS